jgi:hypothetical protein
MLSGCHASGVLTPLGGAAAVRAGLEAGRNHGKIVLPP